MISTAIAQNDLGLLASLTSESIRLNDLQRAEYEPIFWRNICSEYDSIHFYHKIKTLKLNYTAGFEGFLGGWLKDEAMHTAGFKKLYQLIYGTNESKLDENLQSRISDFEPIAEFFEDEISICLLLAFDEIVTTIVYRRSIPFYQAVEGKTLPKWIHKVQSDEARHFINISKVIKKGHQFSKQRVERILQRIIEVDTSLPNYNATFVLDHHCPEFPLTKAELINTCARIVLQKII